MSVAVKVDEEGRVAIPREVRERAGLGPGDELRLEEIEGRLVLVRADLPSSLVRAGRRLFKPAPQGLPAASRAVWDETLDAVREGRSLPESSEER